MTVTPHRTQAVEDILRLDGIGYRYPSGTLALDGLDGITVRRGSVLGVVGPSGCGKSTLLQIVAGLAQPTSGSVWRAPVAAGRHPLTMVFQKDTVLPFLTVRANVGLAWRFDDHGLSKAERRSRAEHLLQVAGLAAVADRYPYELSGGMRRRVAFLTAVAPYPEVLLLDEPFSSLDVPTRIGIHQSIHDIVREMDIATILVTHDLEEAISLSDEIIILTGGPGRVAVRHEVPFGPVRTMLELRGDRAFLDLYGELWRDLGAQISASQIAAPEQGPA